MKKLGFLILSGLALASTSGVGWTAAGGFPGSPPPTDWSPPVTYRAEMARATPNALALTFGWFPSYEATDVFDVRYVGRSIEFVTEAARGPIEPEGTLYAFDVGVVCTTTIDPSGFGRCSCQPIRDYFLVSYPLGYEARPLIWHLDGLTRSVG